MSEEPEFPDPAKVRVTHGFTPEERERVTRAARDTGGNPSEVVRAFAGDGGVDCCGLRLRPVTLATYMLFERLGNPLVDPEGDDPDAYRIAEAVYVLSRPVADSRELLRGGERAWEDAVWALAESIPAADLRHLGEAIGAHFAAAFETLQGGDGPAPGDGAGEGGEKKTASAPTPPGPTTDSDGG